MTGSGRALADNRVRRGAGMGRSDQARHGQRDSKPYIAKPELGRPAGVTVPMRQWLDAAAALEPQLLQSLPLDISVLDLAACQLNRGGLLRPVVDLLPLEEPRLRVRVVTRSGGWWLFDSCGRVAPTRFQEGQANAQETLQPDRGV